MRIAKHFILFLFVMLTAYKGFSQEVEESKYQEINPYGENTGGFRLVEKWPMYPNGIEGINQDLANNLIYPEKAKIENIEGKVIVSFVVQIDGSIGEIKVVESAHTLLNQEAIRVITTLRKWKPAIQNGKPVKTAYQHVIDFNL